MAVINF